MSKYAVMVYPCGDYDVFEIKGLLADFLPQILGGPVKRVDTTNACLAAFRLADVSLGEYSHAAENIGANDLPFGNIVFLHNRAGIACGFTLEQLQVLIDNRLEPAKLVEQAYWASNCEICPLFPLCDGVNCRDAWRVVIDAVRMLNAHRGITAELIIREGCEPWRDAIADPPGPLDLLDNSEFLVMIRSAVTSTTLFYSDAGEWVDEHGNVYAVTHWMPMPGRPNE